MAHRSCSVTLNVGDIYASRLRKIFVSPAGVVAEMIHFHQTSIPLLSKHCVAYLPLIKQAKD